jgi:hypothetical protein
MSSIGRRLMRPPLSLTVEACERAAGQVAGWTAPFGATSAAHTLAQNAQCRTRRWPW